MNPNCKQESLHLVAAPESIPSDLLPHDHEIKQLAGQADCLLRQALHLMPQQLHKLSA